MMPLEDDASCSSSESSACERSTTTFSTNAESGSTALRSMEHISPLMSGTYSVAWSIADDDSIGRGEGQGEAGTTEQATSRRNVRKTRLAHFFSRGAST